MDRVGCGTSRFPGPEHLDPWRRATHRRHHLLHRNLAGADHELGGKRPVLALTPGVGDIDIAVASELLEAGRTVATALSRRTARM